jgi:hypothetical protein
MKLETSIKLIAENVDVSTLVKLVLNIQTRKWHEWTYRQDRNTVNADTLTVPFLWTTDIFNKPIQFFNQTEEVWFKIKKFVDLLEKFYNGKAVIVMLTKVLPEKQITPHCDCEDLVFIHRCHIPVFTNPKVKFTVSGVDHYLKSGNIYELSNTEIHGVKNESSNDRIHLMIDILPSKS